MSISPNREEYGIRSIAVWRIGIRAVLQQANQIQPSGTIEGKDRGTMKTKTGGERFQFIIDKKENVKR